MLGQKQKFDPLVRSFDLSRSSINEDSRTVDVVFSTETDKVERWFGVEILDHGPKSVRMDRLRNAAPLLLDHDTRQQIGVIESADLSGKSGVATVRFSKSEKGEEIFQDVKDGIRSKISVGYRVHELKLEASDKKTKRDTYRVTDWEPFEISLVAVPADDSAGVRDADSIFGQRAASLSTYIAMSNDTENQERALEAPEAPAPAPVAAETPKTEERSLNADKVLSEIEISRLAEKRASEEVQRREDIREYAKRFNRPDAEVRDAITKGVSVDDFKRNLVDKLSAEHPAFQSAPVQENAGKAEKGSRAYTMQTWSESAKAALGSRGAQIEIPDYSRITTVERNYIGGNDLPFHRSMTGALTLVDVAQLDAGLGYPVINETVNHSPEVASFPVEVISGSTIELSVLTGTPTVGFRNANEGSTSKKGTFESRIFQTQVIEEPIVVDIQGVLRASKDPGRVLMNEAMAVSSAVLKHLGVQTWYAGTAQSGADTKAAPGIIAQMNSASTHYVDASGSSAKSSVYFVQLGDTSVGHVYGNDNTLSFGSDWNEETVESAAGYKLRALVNFISGRVAPRVANKNGVVRIKNLAASTQTLTDALMYDALRKCDEVGCQPNAIYMSPRSLYQLRSSRTATNPSGTPAEVPTNFAGIPIYMTRNISDAETV